VSKAYRKFSDLDSCNVMLGPLKAPGQQIREIDLRDLAEPGTVTN
jgi:hypothetical protein